MGFTRVVGKESYSPGDPDPARWVYLYRCVEHGEIGRGRAVVAHLKQEHQQSPIKAESDMTMARLQWRAERMDRPDDAAADSA